MSGVVRLNLVHRAQNVLHCAEPEQSAARWNEFAEARFLRDDRPACREVTTRPIAEPTGVRTHVLVAGNRELAVRFLDVTPVELGIAGDFDGVALQPAVVAQKIL